MQAAPCSSSAGCPTAWNVSLGVASVLPTRVRSCVLSGCPDGTAARVGVFLTRITVQHGVNVPLHQVAGITRRHDGFRTA